MNLSHLQSPDIGLVIIKKIICKIQFDPENQGGGGIFGNLDVLKNMRFEGRGVTVIWRNPDFTGFS